MVSNLKCLLKKQTLSVIAFFFTHAPSLQVLHIHLMNHIEGGNYTYHHAEKTAFPVRNLVCSSTQTEAIHVADTASQTDDSDDVHHDLDDVDNACANYQNVKVELENTDYDDSRTMFSNDGDICSISENEPMAIKMEACSPTGTEVNSPFETDMHTAMNSPNSLNVKTLTGQQRKLQVKKFKEIVIIRSPRKGIALPINFVKQRKDKPKKGDIKKVTIKRTSRPMESLLVPRQKKCKSTEDDETVKLPVKKIPKDSLKVQRQELIQQKQKCDKRKILNYSFKVKPKKLKAEKLKPPPVCEATRHKPPSQLYHCHLCPTQFAKKKLMCLHIESDHAGQYQWKCDTCRVPFVTEEEYSFHVKHCTNSWCKSHSCSHCCHQNLFLSRKLLLAHLRDCHDDIFPMNCNICNVPLASDFDGREHMVEHTKQGLKCRFCDMMSKSVIESEIHMMSHVKANPLTCYICDKVSGQPSHLLAHVHTHFDEGGSFICELCGASFAMARKQHAHFQICKKQFECKTCGKAFANKKDMEEHENVHDGGKKYICDQCGAAYSYRCALTRHIKCRHSDDPIVRFTCSVCQKLFFSKTSLDRHLLIHENILPFQCQYCEKKFRSKWNHDAHVRQHTGVKPYVCTKCGLAFTHNVVRKTHEAKCNIYPDQHQASVNNTMPLLAQII